jgi:SAM-dependent methyltransferase
MVSLDLAVAAALFTLVAFIVYLFLSGLLWGSGWSPTSRRQLEAAARLLELNSRDTVYDLGSGFGRAVIFFAKNYHVSVVGVEIDPLRRLVTVESAKRQGLDVTVMRGNLLDVDLREASKVFFFLTPLLMRRLQDKVGKEMRPGALVVSVDHRFPDWTPVESVENVHLYIVGRSGS